MMLFLRALAAALIKKSAAQIWKINMVFQAQTIPCLLRHFHCIGVHCAMCHISIFSHEKTNTLSLIPASV